MPKSKHRKVHKAKLANYKANKKKEQASLKKKLIEEYMKRQQDVLAEREKHTSEVEIDGLDLNVDEVVKNWDNVETATETKTEVNVDVSNIEDVKIENIDVDVEPILKTNDNDNQQ